MIEKREVIEYLCVGKQMLPHELVAQYLSSRSKIDTVVELQWKTIVEETMKMVLSLPPSPSPSLLPLLPLPLPLPLFRLSISLPLLASAFERNSNAIVKRGQ
jgi:hypothetical protein